MEWISFKVKSPEIGQCILMIDDSNSMPVMEHFLKYDSLSEMVNSEYWGFKSLIRSTHWMPLPSLPREEKSE